MLAILQLQAACSAVGVQASSGVGAAFFIPAHPSIPLTLPGPFGVAAATGCSDREYAGSQRSNHNDMSSLTPQVWIWG